jgi:hypothetical protein
LQRQTNKECKFEQQESWRLQKPLTTYLIGKCSCQLSFMQIFCGKFKYKIENNMKVTKKDILSIKAGSSKVMQLDSYKDCVNARSYAYQLAFTDPREDVERYSISIDKDKNQITIEAIKK